MLCAQRESMRSVDTSHLGKVSEWWNFARRATSLSEFLFAAGTGSCRVPTTGARPRCGPQSARSLSQSLFAPEIFAVGRCNGGVTRQLARLRWTSPTTERKPVQRRADHATT